MRKIDAFAHILPAEYLQQLERHLTSTMRPARLRYYREGVFRFDPVISDLDARLRLMDRYGDYAQVLVLGVPPLEEVDPPEAAAELARRFPERFVGFAAALPLGDVEAHWRRSTMRSGSSARSASRCSPTWAARRWTTPASTRSSRGWRRSTG